MKKVLLYTVSYISYNEIGVGVEIIAKKHIGNLDVCKVG